MPDWVSCPLCESGDLRVALDDGGGQLVKCRSCAFLYVNPQPTQSELESIYDGYYGEGDALAEALTCRQPVFEHGVEVLGRLKPAGRLLDIGCGTGDFLMAARTAGWEAWGVELSKRAVAYAVGRGLQVREGTLADAQFASDQFDVVTFWDVLEHLPRPRQEILETHRILRRGGLVVVRVPNTRFQVFKMHVRRRLFGREPRALQSDLHLNHFTPLTLRSLLKDSGFRTLREEVGIPENFVHRQGFPLWLKRLYCHVAEAAYLVTGIQLGPTLVSFAEKI